MDGFKKSGFTELQEIEPINTEHRPSEPPLKDVDVALQVDDALDVVPIDERWSWNPLDWFRAIKKEITEVNFELTEKKRVVSTR